MSTNESDVDPESFSREQLVPLALLRLNHSEPIRGLTRFQKITFLAQKGGLSDDPIRSGVPLYFEYRPEKYGPYSEGLSETLEDLRSRGMIIGTEIGESEHASVEYSLHDRGRRVLNQRPRALDSGTIRTLKLSKTLYNEMPIAELLDRVYAAYPEFNERR